MAWKRSDWNDVIRRVNLLAQRTDACRDITPLQEVDPNHIWSVDDIRSVRDTLAIICGNNAFSAPLDKWRQAAIDEINQALIVGWCGCPDEANCWKWDWEVQNVADISQTHPFGTFTCASGAGTSQEVALQITAFVQAHRGYPWQFNWEDLNLDTCDQYQPRARPWCS